MLFSLQARTSDGSEGIWSDRRARHRRAHHIRKAEVFGDEVRRRRATDTRREAGARGILWS
jgi:hypothetical protein